MSNYLKHKSGSLEDTISNQSSQKFKEDSGYQKMFQKEQDNAGRMVGSMTPKEKQAFYNKIDNKYEGMETMVPNKKDNPEDLKRKTTMTGEKPTKVDMEPSVKMDTNPSKPLPKK